MSESILKRALKEDWYLFVLLAAVFLAAAFMFLRPSPTHATKDLPLPPGIAMDASATGVSVPEAPQESQSASHDPVTRDEDQARAAIADYGQRVKDDPKAEETPGLRLAMANLTMVKLHDYKDAARQYELLLYDYPDWDGDRTSYIQLIACYEQLNDADNARSVYKKMMAKFPPGSQEHLYAKAQLGME